MSPRIAILAFALLSAYSASPRPASVAPTKVAELAGRTAGKPQRCLGAQSIQLFTTSASDPHVLLYDDGKTIWVSQLDASCEFGPSETIIPTSAEPYYCRGDFVRQGSRVQLNPFGRSCVLGDFTPYRSAK
jgi:hypothetical protein